MILSNICWGDRLDFALNHLAHFLLEGHGGQNAFYAWFYVGIDIGLGHGHSSDSTQCNCSRYKCDHKFDCFLTWVYRFISYRHC